MSNQISKLERILRDKLSKSFDLKTVAYQGGSFSPLDFKSCTIMPFKGSDGKPIIPGQCMEAMATEYCSAIGGVIGATSKCVEQPDVFVSKYDRIENTPSEKEIKTTASDDKSCLRFPQPWPWVERDPNGGTFSVGGGNTCGDPYLGWHPSLKDKLRPYSDRMNEKMIAKKYPQFAVNDPVTGKPMPWEGIYICGTLVQGKLGEPTDIPYPFITIYADTRNLVPCPHSNDSDYGYDTPCPNGHVIPGMKGPPYDGGIWRGYSERNTIMNPKFIEWIKAHFPDCFESNICNGTALERQGPYDAGIAGTERRLALACLARQICKNDQDYAIFTKPVIKSDEYPGNVECENSFCENINKAFDHVNSNGDVPDAANEPSWLKTAYNPKVACEKLTGIPKNGGPCTGPILSRNYLSPQDPCYGTYVIMARANTNGGYQPSNGKCWNCMVFYNMNTGGWGGSDHPMPKEPAQIVKIMEDLVSRGCNVDWVQNQGCSFEVYR